MGALWSPQSTIPKSTAIFCLLVHHTGDQWSGTLATADIWQLCDNLVNFIAPIIVSGPLAKSAIIHQRYFASLICPIKISKGCIRHVIAVIIMKGAVVQSTIFSPAEFLRIAYNPQSFNSIEYLLLEVTIFNSGRVVKCQICYMEQILKPTFTSLHSKCPKSSIENTDIYAGPTLFCNSGIE